VLPGSPHWLSPVDLSSGLAGIECRLQAHADIRDLEREYADAALTVLKYLLSL
jgi:hypothetical protein